MALSEFKISKAKRKDKPYKLADGGGLFLLVNRNGSKLWRQKYRHMGKERLLSHGQYPDVTLAQARQKRDEARGQLADGKDPAVEKKLAQINVETQSRTTFKLIAEEYIENMEERGRAPATMIKKRWILLDLSAPLHKRPITEITSAELLQDLEEYTGWRIIIEALTFQILTMTRPGEVRGAKKQEFDLKKRTWTIPSERMKMRREHVIPLSDQALKIVEGNWPEIEDVDLIFPSLVSNRKWLSENAFNSALRRMGYTKEEVTAHGFRATASTILNSLGFEPDVIEAALAHQDKNVIRRTYNRATYLDQRIKLMQDWADLMDGFRDGHVGCSDALPAQNL